MLIRNIKEEERGTGCSGVVEMKDASGAIAGRISCIVEEGLL